jgi:hypothetical protein
MEQFVIKHSKELKAYLESIYSEKLIIYIYEILKSAPKKTVKIGYEGYRFDIMFNGYNYVVNIPREYINKVR